MEYIDTPLFGFILTILAFQIGDLIYKKTRNPILNPTIIAQALIIFLLLSFKIDYGIYNKGGSIITFFLAPATVILALPLYRQVNKLKSNAVPIIGGVLVGTSSIILSIIYLGKLLGLSTDILLSLVPKSATTAISQEVSAQIGGIPALTIVATTITGITGNALGYHICKLFGIKDEIALGLSLGTTSHALGTAKAMELGETQGAMSSLAISLAGLTTVILAPILTRLLM